MKKNILSFILSGVCLLGLSSFQAHAEWRQNNNLGSWSYYDNNGNKVRNEWIDNKYFVDGNGIWLEENEYNKKNFYAVTYFEDTGIVGGVCASGDKASPVGGLEYLHNDEPYKPCCLVVPSSIEEDFSNLLDYKVVTKEDGTLGLEKYRYR